MQGMSIIRGLMVVVAISAQAAVPNWANLAERLGWQKSDAYRCEGYFSDQKQEQDFLKKSNDVPVGIPKVGEAKSHGGVLLKRPNIRIQANGASMRSQQSEGALDDVAWRWQSHFWGWAERFFYHKSDDSTIEQAGMSRCQPDKPAWWWTAAHIDLDSHQGVGRLWHAWFRVKGVPVFYLPFVQLPIDNRSHSGFFVPSWGGGQHMGHWIALPMFWTLGNHMQALLTPAYAHNSGWMMRGRWRWYTPFAQTQFQGIGVSDQAWSGFQSTVAQKYGADPSYQTLEDKVNAQSGWRYGWGLLQQGHYDRLQWRINWNKVSDDWMYLHFPSHFSFFDKRRIPQMLSAKASVLGGNGRVDWMRMQTFRWFDQPTYPHVYARWPNVEWQRFWRLGHLGTFQFQTKWTRFIGHDTASLDHELAQRWVLQPSWQHPLHILGGWGQWLVGLHGVHTHADGSGTSQWMPYVQSWHHWLWQSPWGKGRRQWQSSVGYLYIPHRNQDAMPILDAEAPSWVGHTFYQTNRFAGDDVWGDANELRFRLERNWLQREGGERWQFAVEQDVALTKHRAFALLGAQVDPMIDHHASPLMLQFDYRSPNHWQWLNQMSYDSAQTRIAMLQSKYHYENEEHQLSAFFMRLLELPSDTVSDGVYQSMVGMKWQYHLSDNWSWSWSSYAHARPGFDWNHQWQLHYQQCCWGIKFAFTQRSGDGTGVQQSNHLRSFSITLSTEGL